MIIRKEGDNSIGLNWDNGTYLGYCYREVDGYYVFVFGETRDGAWGGYVLREIADVLTDLNKEWDEKVKSVK